MSIILGAMGGAGTALANIGQTQMNADIATQARQQESDLALQRAESLEQYKMQLVLDRQKAVLGIGSMPNSSSSPQGPQPSAASGGASTSQAYPQTAQGGAPSSQPGMSSSQSNPAASQPSSSGDVNAWDIPGIAAKYGISEAAIRNDLAYNNGKGIAQMINERTKPDKIVVNGLLIDKNQTPSGFIGGQVFTDSQGHTIMLGKGQDGQPQVMIPKGALEAQGAQAGVAAGVKAATTPIKVYNPATQREEYRTEASVIGAPPQVQPEPGLRGNFVGSPEQISAQIASIADPQERANAQSAFEEQMRRTNGNLPGSTSNAASNIPSAGGGVAAGPSTSEAATASAQKEFLTKRAGAAADDEVKLNERVRQGSDLNMRLQEQIAALDQFKAGGGAETRAHLAQLAQAIPGIPQSVVNGVAGGNLAAMQEFNKLAAQTAMEQLKQAMGGSGRVSQFEFKVFLQNNPNLSTDPNAIRKIFDFNNRIYNRDLAEQQAYNAFIKNGGDPGEFASNWSTMQSNLGITKPSMSAQPKSNGWAITRIGQ